MSTKIYTVRRAKALAHPVNTFKSINEDNRLVKLVLPNPFPAVLQYFSSNTANKVPDPC